MQSELSTQKGNARLIQSIESEIRRNGPLPFARFMEMALYDPQYGYYMTLPHRETYSKELGEGRIGWSGDFYTVPDVHPLLARALLRQIQEVDELLHHPSTLTILEMGGGKGILAKDILQECEIITPDLFARLRYLIVECSPIMKATQEYHLGEFLQKGVPIQWASSLSELESDQVTGVMFSNELIDALPVHRVSMKNGFLQEVYVGSEGSEFVEQYGEFSTEEIAEYLHEAQVNFSEGYTTEVHLKANIWMKAAAQVLNQGIMVTIDYGHTAKDYYHPNRRNGTLLCYRNHKVIDDPYVRVGEQDMTAHVNFSALALSGIRNGLTVSGFTNLMSFLLSLGADEMLADLDQESKELESAIQLLRPNGIGGTFKVLIQQKSLKARSLRGLRYRPFFEGAL